MYLYLRETTVLAAKQTISKSDAIREVLAKQSGATVKEIAAVLKTRRIKASVALISKVKYGQKPSKRGGKRGRPATNGSVHTVSLEHLLAAKHLVEKLGGVDAAWEALANLAKLMAD
jgi:hypothetical protein